MKFVVVDLQGFCTPEFYAKELAIYDGKNMQSYMFKPAIPFHELKQDYKRQVKYLCGNHHGIYYNNGELDYQEIYSIVYENLRDVDVIYVKGHSKHEFLAKLLSEIETKRLPPPHIVNLEFTSAANNVPKLDKKQPIHCTFHSLNLCICSVNYAFTLYDYIVSLLPKNKNK